MNEITKALMQYRECCRSLWNVYLFPVAEEIGWDVVDDFRDISRLLFTRLVTDRVGDVSLNDGTSAPQYIRVIPIPGDQRIMILRHSSTSTMKYWDDPISNVNASEIELQFTEFFDWQDLAIRDFQYYKVVIRAFAEHPDRVGREALMEVGHANLELVELKA
jgi:hypothetical protein